MEKHSRTYSIVMAIVVVVVLAGAAIFIITLFSSTNTEPEAVFGDSSIEITGQYGETILYNDITNVSLEDSIPKIGYKRDGAGLGEIKKGRFDVEGMGECRLFIMSEKGPYVVLNTNDGYVIINYKDPEKTKALYEELLKYA